MYRERYKTNSFLSIPPANKWCSRKNTTKCYKIFDYIKNKIQKNYDLKMAIVEAENAHNSSIHTTTKEIPKELFNNNNKILLTTVKENITEVNKNINNNKNPIKINSFVLLSNNYIKKGNKLDVKFKIKGIKCIHAIVVDNNQANSYKIKILTDIGDIKKMKYI